jgi:SPP1 family predicted phage head-tail adaptor
MNIGKLRDQIIIQQKTVTYNALNEEIQSWSTYATVWAEVMIGSGREYWGAKKLNAELDGIIKIRYNSGVTELMQVVYNSKTYQVSAPPIQDVKKSWTELHVKKVE